MRCDICGRDRECAETIRLTAEVKAALTEAGVTPPEEYHYCGPCWRVVSNREQGAQLLSGFFQTTLTGLGHTNARKAGEKMHTFLIEKSKPGGTS